ncbi:MAG: SprB repeat-containing protein, partial [Mariniphaga sp.]
MRKLAYILLMTLLVAAHAAAQDTIDVVCQGADRFYRVDGVENSDWVWTLENEAGDTIITPVFTWNDFSDTDSDGNSIQGSEINIRWDVEPGTYSLSVEQTSNYISVVDGTTYIHCENHELGKVIVVPGPEAIAGDDILACAGDNVFLEGATASNYDSLRWETLGDGFFSDPKALHPTYFPGEGDIASGNVALSLIAFGQGYSGSCVPGVDMVTITFGQPEIVLSADIPLCYGDNSGTVAAAVSGGFGTYTYAWTGPDGFTADTSDISGLASGMYY